MNESFLLKYASNTSFFCLFVKICIPFEAFSPTNIIGLDIEGLNFGSIALDNSIIRLSRNERSLSISNWSSSNVGETPLVKGLDSMEFQTYAFCNDSSLISEMNEL